MLIFTKPTYYRNFYTGKQEYIELKWKVENGFKSKEAAENELRSIGQNPTVFSYVQFQGMYYPVGICTTSREIVLAKNYVWIRNVPMSRYRSGAGYPFIKQKRKMGDPLPFEFECSRISSCWSQKMTNVMETFDENFKCFECANASGTRRALMMDCLVLFGCAMFDSMIPVYELNCVDSFFSCPPSRMKKWEKGIKAFNPFSDMKEFSDGTVTYENLLGYEPYTFQQYMVEVHGK